MYIHSFSPFICDPIDDIEGLKADLKNYTDFFFRRVNKFILLSLLGVHKCIHGKMTGTSPCISRLKTGTRDTENVLHQMYDELRSALQLHQYHEQYTVLMWPRA